MRALELASSVDGRQTRHEQECEKRYLAVDNKLDGIVTLQWRTAIAIIGLLIGIVGVLLKSTLHL